MTSPTFAPVDLFATRRVLLEDIARRLKRIEELLTAYARLMEIREP